MNAVSLAWALLWAGPAAWAEPPPAAAASERVLAQFYPPVVPLERERLVARQGVLDAVCTNAASRGAAERWLSARGVAVLGGPGLTLHFYAEGIDTMSRIDLLWAGLPRRAASLQDLVDHTIRSARASGRPVRHLIITGHAGLPGCSALGGTLDDCTFEGRLNPYQRQQLARLRPYLALDAEIELRQCVTGSGKEGQDLLTAIHHATGAAASSYLADFHFGDTAAHPRVRVDAQGLTFIPPGGQANAKHPR